MKKLVFYIIAVISVFFSSCGKNALDRNALVVDVKSLSFDKDTLWFGGKQDIMIEGLQDSALQIRRVENNFEWYLPKPAYVKFNGNTQNKILLDSISNIRVNDTINISINEIYNELNKQKRLKNLSEIPKYTFLSDVMKVHNNRNNSVIDILKSVIAYSEDEKSIILLDTNIVVTKTNGKDTCFTEKGTIQGNSVKIQFYRTFHSSFLSSKDTAKYFHFGDTCFTTSVKSFYTPFGAKEITLTKEKDSIKVSFNKIYRALIPTQVVDVVCEQNDSIPISLRQMLYANTYGYEVYATNIANPNYWEFGTIDKGYNFTVEQKSCLFNGENESYVLNSGIFWKGLLPLLFVFLVGLMVILPITRNSKISECQTNSDNTRWKWYFIILYFLLFVLSIGRIFIGYNLSFTQPFSVYAFPTAVIVSPLILLCVLLFWVVFLCVKFGFNEILGDIKQKWQRVITYILILFVVLTGIYLIASFLLPDIFKFYWQDFNLLKTYICTLGSEKISIYILTIAFLVITSVFLTALLLVGKKKITKRALLIFILGSMGYFSFQKSSFSVVLLLICILLFWFSSRTKILELDLKQTFGKRIGKWFLLLILLVIIGGIAALFRDDSGYIINLWLFLIIMIIVLMLQYHFLGNKYKNSENTVEMKIKRCRSIFYSCLVILGFIAVIGLLMWWFASNYDPFSSGRLPERSVAYFHFSTIQEFGYRLSEERAQFFSILAKYSYPSNYDCYEPMHQGISSFIDPVIENDLSVPFGLIYQFGTKCWRLPIVFLMSIWIILGFVVLRMSLIPPFESKHDLAKNQKFNHYYFSTYGIIRIFCMSVVLSSGLWLIASYYGVVPFTGRLIYGLGQDSIGEVFETVFLFAFMGLCGIANENKYTMQK